jgi:hypothetical protein
MKKIMLVLIIGILIMRVNVYAADGDFIVDGNLGIGTDTPGAELDVVGSINTDEETGGYKMGGATILKTNLSKRLTFVGSGAGGSNSTGTLNTAVGYHALLFNTDGNFNTALGFWALKWNKGTGNTALGASSLYSNNTGGYNIAIGVNVLYSNSVGSFNVALGHASLYSSLGSNNIGIGYRAGDEITTGSNNIIIGHYVDAPDPVGSNQLSIGNLIFGTGIDGTGLDISSGNIGIGTNAPDAKLQVGEYDDGSEALANAWNTLSDKTLKTNLNKISNAVDKVTRISGYYFNWENGRDTGRHVGVIAQEVHKVLPEIISVDSKGLKSLDYGKLTPLLIEAIKEQQKIINELKAKVQKLEVKDYMAEAQR